MQEMTEFVKGQQYTNRRGTYTVLDVRSKTLTVRYEDGVEETLDVVIQQRILRNMTLPPRTPEPPPRGRNKSRGPAKAPAKAAATAAATAGQD
jgi:hypothetical protein